MVAYNYKRNGFIIRRNLRNQTGVVLIVALVFLIALTAVAAALMQNSTTDMKMSGASEEKVVATQEAISASDEVIFRQVNAAVGNNKFALPIVRFKDDDFRNVTGSLNICLLYTSPSPRDRG